MADCLALHDVSAGYGETVVLEHVSLGVPEGGTLAVLGRNGVGKTTLLATVLGHTTLHAGRSHSAASRSSACVRSSARDSASATCRRNARSSRR